MLRITLIFWMTAFCAEAWCVDFPVRDWTDNQGNVIRAQMVGLDDASITIMRPDSLDVRGKPIKYVVSIDRLSPPDREYYNKLAVLVGKYEMELNKLKPEFPDRSSMERLKAQYLNDGIDTPVYVPTSAFAEKYQRKCNAITFENMDYQISNIRDQASSEIKYFDRDAPGKGVGDIAKARQQDTGWVKDYLSKFLDDLEQLETNFQAAVNGC